MNNVLPTIGNEYQKGFNDGVSLCTVLINEFNSRLEDILTEPYEYRSSVELVVRRENIYNLIDWVTESLKEIKND